MESGIKKGPYAVVTLAYWAFTLTDGALRMLVLLYLHQLGRSPLEIAGLFLFYEFFGVVTNLVGGGLAARFGLRWTLISGLVLQVLALGALGFLAEDLNLVWVMGLQSLSGVAKDLTKMSSKSFMKFLVHPEDSGGLLKVVSWLTGSKNTLKGVGFFVGGALLGGLGFAWACWAMALTLVGILAGASWLLPKAYGKAASKGSWTGWWTRDKRVLWLSLSRLALFAARDVWFVLALPLYLTAQLGWSQGRVGGFLALWVIGYGMVQALAPGWIGRRSGRPGALGLLAWTLALWAPLGWLLVHTAPGALELGIGLGLFGIVFATCSSLHSYLILAYSHGDSVAQQVGAYYSANALGRFLGTFLSGWLYQHAASHQEGMWQALVGAGVLVSLAGLGCWPLWRCERGHAAPKA